MFLTFYSSLFLAPSVPYVLEITQHCLSYISQLQLILLGSENNSNDRNNTDEPKIAFGTTTMYYH